jgi:hypothetical protein
MGDLIFQEGGGSPPFTLEDEPYGCQEVATWVKIGRTHDESFAQVMFKFF